MKGKGQECVMFIDISTCVVARESALGVHIYFISRFLVYRGFYFMFTHTHHLRFQWKVHPPPKILNQIYDLMQFDPFKSADRGIVKILNLLTTFAH
jgi:hypothetical protein